MTELTDKTFGLTQLKIVREMVTVEIYTKIVQCNDLRIHCSL